MSDRTKIEWAHHTFNPWVGCTKVSQACAYCYAERWAKRAGQAELWQGERRRTTAANWRQPLRWDRQAAAAGVRRRVFPSLCDPFDNQVPEEWRRDFWELIASTPNLDWLLLTKRPQNIAKMLPVMDSKVAGYRPWNERWPWRNVWMGVSAGNQEDADRSIPVLLTTPAAVRFVSLEPLLGPVDLRLIRVDENRVASALHGFPTPNGRATLDLAIVGGESGPRARPLHPDWVRSLRDQCQRAGVAFFFKQWGEYRAGEIVRDAAWAGGAFMRGGDGFPATAVIRTIALDRNTAAIRVGRETAGRLLDGRTWDEMPEVAA